MSVKPKQLLGASSTLAKLSKSYELLKKQTASDAKSQKTAQLLVDLISTSLEFLTRHCSTVPLVSKVPGKKYVTFVITGKPGKMSRAVNSALFRHECREDLSQLLQGTLKSIPIERRRCALYTFAMSYCCAADLLKTGDQKTPATFFECLIGHLMSRAFGMNPRTQVEVLRLEEEAGTLPTDFIFDLGGGKPKFHVPVKTSTRERVIQVFAHQRVLDGVHGFGRFTGVLVCLAETKLDHERKEVIEICVPKQWGLYQRFIAPIYRFYYFDVPDKYAALRSADPPMTVTDFGRFFDETGELMVVR